MSTPDVKAGEGSRTHNIQLGRLDGDQTNDLLEQEVTDTDSDACTPACTNSGDLDNENRLAVLAELLAALPKDERAKLAELLARRNK